MDLLSAALVVGGTGIAGMVLAIRAISSVSKPAPKVNLVPDDKPIVLSPTAVIPAINPKLIKTTDLRENMTVLLSGQAYDIKKIVISRTGDYAITLRRFKSDIEFTTRIAATATYRTFWEDITYRRRYP